MSFRKLQRYLDAGHVYYAYEGEGTGTDYLPKRSLGLDLRAGQFVKLRWPDGTVTEEKLSSLDFSTILVDHEVETLVKSELMVIEVSHYGAKGVVDLSGLELYDSSDEGEWSLI